VREGQADRVRAVMAAIDSYARRLAAPGSSLHQHDSFRQVARHRRWPAADDDQRLRRILESYIDEFAEMILSGLDAIWETSYGYPPDGARDLPAFKRFLRSHQVPSEVFYSAYPEETVLNIVNDRAAGERLWVDGRTHRRTATGVSQVTQQSPRFTDDVLAEIQGFVTSGYGHLSSAAYLFLQFQDAGRARLWLRTSRARDHIRPRVADRAQRGEDQADAGVEHRLHRRRARRHRAATEGSQHVSSRVPGGDRDP
jgi:hypothetical protein